MVLLGIDATLGDGREICDHLHSFRKVKCLQRYLKILLMGVLNIETPLNDNWI